MPFAPVNGVQLYYEETGEGCPLVWSHEFAGDYRSWEAQVRFFSRRYRCVTYNSRGYPPSGVPEDPAAYSQEQAVEDLRGLLDHLGIQRAHVAGLSMGGNVALNFAIAHPKRCHGVVVAGCGAGTVDREAFVRAVEQTAHNLLTQGMEAVAAVYGSGPGRLQLKRKDPRGYDEFLRQFSEHSALGSAYTFLGVQARRPTIFSLKDKLNALRVPILLIVGDEDEPCVEPGVFMKREIPGAGLVFLPQSGHAVNLEEPDAFNRAILDFLTLVEAGKWATRE